MKYLENQKNLFNILLITLISIFILLLFRNIGLYPIVFADEYVYSKFSRLLPLKEVYVPNYLYFKIYSITNSCGDKFLDCTKIINALFFVSALPFIYLICRSIAGTFTSLLIAVLAIIGPINSYTAYFMPESMYFLSFWASVWILLKQDHDSTNYKWILAGAIYGVSILVKPHSLFFLPAILIYLLHMHFRAKTLLSWKSFDSIIFFVSSALIVKFIISYLLAGSAGLTLFGSFYNSMATSSSNERIIELLSVTTVSFIGHLFIMFIMYGLPITIILSTVLQYFIGGEKNLQNKNTQEIQFEKIIFLSLLIISNLLCVTAIFTASVASAAIYETPYRLHMRYYNFALPMLYIVSAGAIYLYNSKANKYIYTIFGSAIAIIACYAIFNNLYPYTPNFVDSPEIHGLQKNPIAFKIIGGLLISTLLLWLFAKNLGTKAYTFIALPIFVTVSSFYITADLNNRKISDVYDNAGIFTKQYLTDDDISKTIIIGFEPAGLYRSLFYLDNPEATLEVIPKDTTYDFSTLPPSKEWVLIIGDHPLPKRVIHETTMSGFKLVRISIQNNKTIDFKNQFWPGVINKAQGLHSAEDWGAWSISDSIDIEFSNPLPDAFDLHLTARAFGPNIGEEFEIHVGSSVSTFKLADADSGQVIRLLNPEQSRVIHIKIPHPTTPKALGLSDDERKLGIGLVEMRIIPTE